MSFALEAMEILLREQPGLPQVACFDTAFHRSLPLVEQVLPLPYAAFERGLRRYGFHGLSYEYIADVLPQHLGDRADGKVIVAKDKRITVKHIREMAEAGIKTPLELTMTLPPTPYARQGGEVVAAQLAKVGINF